jgi:hypothetical protein
MNQNRSAKHGRPQPDTESATDILDEPLHDDDLNTEIDRAGRGITKVTAFLGIAVLVALAFAAGVWVGSAAHSAPNPVIEEPRGLPAATEADDHPPTVWRLPIA